MQLSSCNEPKKASTMVGVGGGRGGTQVTPSQSHTWGRMGQALVPQGRIAALSPRRTQKARTAGGCQLTTPALSSRPAWRGSASPCRGPTLISRASLPVHADDFLVEMKGL